ncbi:MAG: hypothetical protein WCK90_03580 [archaeon]
MTEQYRPGKLEVLGRIASKGYGEVSTFGKGFRAGIVFPFAIKSVFSDSYGDRYDLGEKDANGRQIMVYERQVGQVEKINHEMGWGAFLGFVIGMSTVFAAAVESNNWYILLTPVATNIASVIIERGQGIYSSTREELIKEKRTQTNDDLVTRLEARK